MDGTPALYGVNQVGHGGPVNSDFSQLHPLARLPESQGTWLVGRRSLFTLLPLHSGLHNVGRDSSEGDTIIIYLRLRVNKTREPPKLCTQD